jgi:Flp pilus assembly protein CpaB
MLRECSRLSVIVSQQNRGKTGIRMADRGWAKVNKKFLIMGGIAIVFGGLSIVAADFWLKNNVQTVVETVEVPAGGAPLAEFSTIVVAAEPMRYGALIDAGMLKELPWPER